MGVGTLNHATWLKMDYVLDAFICLDSLEKSAPNSSRGSPHQKGVGMSAPLRLDQAIVVTEYAKLMGITRSAVTKAIREKRLEGWKFGKIWVLRKPFIARDA